MSHNDISELICKMFLVDNVFIYLKVDSCSLTTLLHLPVMILNTIVTTYQHEYLVVKNSMSLLVFSSILLEASSSISCEISGRLLLLPPRLRLDDVEEELRPESGTGDAWHSRRKSKPPEHNRGTGV